VRSGGRYYLLVLGAAAAFSTSGLFIRWTVAGSSTSALALAFWRDLATFLCLLAGLTLFRPRFLRVERRDLPWLAALGAVGIGAFHALWNLTILHLGYAVATVLVYSSPAFVTLMAWLIWREPLTRYKLISIALIFAGCVLAAGREQVAAIQWTAGGLVLGLVTAMACGCLSLFGRQVASRYSPWTVLLYGFGFGALVLLPFQFASASSGPPLSWPVPASTWIWFAGLVLVATILPFAAYVAGLRWLPASIASILLASEVVLSALIGYLFFSETLAALQILGAGLVIAGVSLIAIKGND
jgi:DME family drug/metabolite transporter